VPEWLSIISVSVVPVVIISGVRAAVSGVLWTAGGGGVAAARIPARDIEGTGEAVPAREIIFALCLPALPTAGTRRQGRHLFFSSFVRPVLLRRAALVFSKHLA
jgi:hypothetical protein